MTVVSWLTMPGMDSGEQDARDDLHRRRTHRRRRLNEPVRHLAGDVSTCRPMNGTEAMTSSTIAASGTDRRAYDEACESMIATIKMMN